MKNDIIKLFKGIVFLYLYLTYNFFLKKYFGEEIHSNPAYNFLLNLAFLSFFLIISREGFKKLRIKSVSLNRVYAYSSIILLVKITILLLVIPSTIIHGRGDFDLTGIFFAPVFEEFVFCILIFIPITNLSNKYVGTVVSSIIFAFLHGSDFLSIITLTAFLSRIIFNGCYFNHRVLAEVILIHFVSNFIIITYMFLPEKGPSLIIIFFVSFILILKHKQIIKNEWIGFNKK